MPSAPRRSLAQAPGAVSSRGEARLVEPLRRAWALAAETEPDRLTHGFHTYPGRMHPAVAAQVIADVAGSGATVLDPFCGGGTVLVEAMVAGCEGIGVDLNPLALRIAEVRCAIRDDTSRERFRTLAAAIGEASEARVRGRVDSRAPLPKWELQWYQVHILKELAGLWAEIRTLPLGEDRRALEMVFSAIVVKFSRQRAETTDRKLDRRLRKGLVTEFFVRKADELVERWGELADAVPKGSRAPRLIEGDALRLPRLLERRRVDLVLTSPPYGGTYDYVEHHARRYPWLGMKTDRFRKHELGARRRHGEGTRGDWDREVGHMLDAIAQVLAPGGVAVVLVGDGQLGRERVAADGQLEQLAPRAGLRVCAVASQPRADWRGGPPRKEHLVALAPGPRVAPTDRTGQTPRGRPRPSGAKPGPKPPPKPRRKPRKTRR